MLNLQAVIYGLIFLFLEPNYDDPLNKEAAVVMRDNPNQFKQVCARVKLESPLLHLPTSQNVSRAMRGQSIGGVNFDNCLVSLGQSCRL